MLIHEGYSHLDEAVSYLQSRAFPADTELLLLSVSDLFRTPLHLVGKEFVAPDLGCAARSHRLGKHKKTQIFFDKLESVRRQAHARLQAAFPDWNIRFERPLSWQPNLIILAAFNQSTTSNFGLGELIRKLSAESTVPVIVARSQSQTARRPSVIAFDGPASAAAILRDLPRQPSDKGSDFQLMFYQDPLMTHAERWSAGYEERDREWIDSQLVKTKTAIEALGHKVNLVPAVGHTAQTILNEAKRVDAESILMGTTPMASLGSLSVHSIAAAVAAQASCSVEIVFSERQARPTATLQAIAAAQNIAVWKGRNVSRAGVAVPM